MPTQDMPTQEEIEAKLFKEYIYNRPIYEKIINIAKAQIEYELIKIRLNKKPWERIEVIARIKEFSSALDKIKRPREARVLEPTDSFAMLKDMAGLKIRVFPNSYLESVENIIKSLFRDLEGDHKPSVNNEIDEEDYHILEYLKYAAKLRPEYGINTNFEVQIVPFLLDSFMNVEHDIIFKPGEGLPPKEKIARRMKPVRDSAIGSLISFAAEFSRNLEKSWEPKPTKS